MRQFTLKQLLLTVTMICIGMGLGAFALRPEKIPLGVTASSWDRVDKPPRVAAGTWSVFLIVGGIASIMSGAQTKSVLRYLGFALLVSLLLGLAALMLLWPTQW